MDTRSLSSLPPSHHKSSSLDSNAANEFRLMQLRTDSSPSPVHTPTPPPFQHSQSFTVQNPDYTDPPSQSREYSDPPSQSRSSSANGPNSSTTSPLHSHGHHTHSFSQSFSSHTASSSGSSSSSSSSKSNISVSVRVRPFFNREVPAEWNLTEREISNHQQKWNFDRVFDPSTSTEIVYAAKIQPIVAKFLEGFNGTVMAYGQSGSGKTHTLLGDGNGDGILQMALNDIFFQTLNHKDLNFTVRVDPIEVYLKEARHLLEPPAPVTVMKKRVASLPCARPYPVVKTMDDINEVLNRALSVRMQGISNYNEHSSRSHFIFRIMLTGQPRGSSSRLSGFESELLFVDLAGSERMLDKNVADKHGLSEEELGQHRAQGNAINSSLLFLHIVIDQLSRSAPHVAYNDHILTKILENSLGGNSRTSIICTVSGAVEHRDFTTKTLSFGSSARLVKTTSKKNVGCNFSAEEQKLFAKMQADLLKWQKRCQELEARNAALENGLGDFKLDNWDTWTEVGEDEDGVREHDLESGNQSRHGGHGGSHHTRSRSTHSRRTEDDHDNDEDEEDDGVRELSTTRSPPSVSRSGTSTPSGRPMNGHLLDQFDLASENANPNANANPNSSPLFSPLMSPIVSPHPNINNFFGHPRVQRSHSSSQTPNGSPPRSRSRTPSRTTPLSHSPYNGSSTPLKNVPHPQLSRRSSSSSLTRSDSFRARSNSLHLANEHDTQMNQKIKELSEKVKEEVGHVRQQKKLVEEHVKTEKRLEHQQEKLLKEMERMKRHMKSAQELFHQEKEKYVGEIKQLQLALKNQVKLTEKAEKQAEQDRLQAKQMEEYQKKAAQEVEALKQKLLDSHQEIAKNDAAHARALEEQQPFMRPRRLFGALGLILHRKTLKQELHDVEILRHYR